MLLQIPLLIVASALAAAETTTRTLSSTRSTEVSCQTIKGFTRHSGPVPTSTRTTTSSADVRTEYSTSQPRRTVTVTAPAYYITSTRTTTKITYDYGIDETFTTTKTYTRTDVDYITSTITSQLYVEKTITSLSTYTVPTPSAFIAVYDSTNLRNPLNRRVGSEHSENDVQEPEKRSPNVNGELAKRAPPTYPQRVNCVKKIHPSYTKQIIDIRETQTVRVTKPGRTSTRTTTYTSTSTEVPDNVTRTVTRTTTVNKEITSIETEITTIKSTLTQTVATVTSVYAACATNNLLGPSILKNRQSVIAAIQPGNLLNSQSLTPAVSAYDCCIQCFNLLGQCAYSAYRPLDGCLIVNIPLQATCRLGSRSFLGSFQYQNLLQIGGSTGNDEEGYVLSNGPCGSYQPGSALGVGPL